MSYTPHQYSSACEVFRFIYTQLPANMLKVVTYFGIEKLSFEIETSQMFEAFVVWQLVEFDIKNKVVQNVRFIDEVYTEEGFLLNEEYVPIDW